MMTDVAKDPWMSANVIFDILNEPDSYGLTWGPNGNQLAGMGLGYWYHQIMSTGYGINPSAPALLCPISGLACVRSTTSSLEGST